MLRKAMQMESVARIKDDKGLGHERAVFSFASGTTVRLRTDAGDEYLIERPGSVEGGMSTRTGGTFALIGPRGDYFRLMILSPLPAGTFTLYNIHRKKLVEQILGPHRVGAHRLDIPMSPPGVYSLRISLGEFTGCAYLVRALNRNTLMQRFPDVRRGIADLRSTSALGRQGSSVRDALRHCLD
jgi:hypothetical protein